MAGDHEVELKLELDAEAMAAVRATPLLAAAAPRKETQRSTYYDTKKGSLRKAGYTLRVREVGDRFVQTAKPVASGAGLFNRAEWESDIPGPAPDVSALAGTPLAPLLTPETLRKLRPVFVSEVERTVWNVSRDGSDIEVALDVGSVAADGAVQALRELELELKRGETASVFALARAIGERTPLRIGVLSKAERGEALVAGRAGRISKAGSVEVSSDIDVADGFATIVRACLRHFRLNEPLVAETRVPEALHQARVAMRRLRSAFSLFAPALRDNQFEALREELRWLTAKLGDARNLDVFLGREEGDRPSGVERARLETAREKAYDAVAEALESKRFRDLMIDLLAWTETGNWRDRRRARAPLGAFAEGRLDRLWRKVAEAGAVMTSLEEKERHRRRIEIKKLRYAVEFLAGLYRARASEQKRFTAALEAMQESLGHLNDLATARSLVASLAEDPGGEAEPDTAREESLYLAEAEKNFRKLLRAGPFWR